MDSVYLAEERCSSLSMRTPQCLTSRRLGCEMTPPTGTEFVDGHYTLYLWTEDPDPEEDEEDDDRSDEEYYGDH